MKEKELSEKLFIAVRNGDLKEVQLLHSKGANVNTVDNFGESALTYAIKHKNLKVAKYLIRIGANYQNVNALIQAINHNDWRIAKILIKAGASLNDIDKHIRATLDLSLEIKDSNLVRYLRKGSKKKYRKLFSYEQKHSFKL